MKRLMMALCAICLLALSIPAMAQMGSGPRGHMMGGQGGQWGWYGQDDYQVSPEQQKAFQDIHQQYYKQMSELANKLWSRRAQLNGALAEDSVNRDRVDKLAKEVGDMMSQYYQMRVKMLMDMREKGLPFYGMGMMGGGMMGGGMMHGGGMMGGYHGYGMGWGPNR